MPDALSHNDASLYCGVTFNLAVLQRNYAVLQESVGASVRCSAVLKADAYGMGMLPCGKALYDVGCRDFFVAYLDEAVNLRTVLPLKARIYTFNGSLPGTEDMCLRHHIIPVLTDMDKIKRFAAFSASQPRPLSAVIHIDTAMNRTGIRAEDLEDPGYVQRLKEHLLHIDVVLCMSHLACSDDLKHPLNALQKERFDQAVTNLFGDAPPPLSLANSSGIALGSAYHYDMVRPGRALHNIEDPLGLPLHSYGTLWTRIYQVQDIKPGDGVGYNRWFVADTPRTIATLSFGYADGYVWTGHQKNQKMDVWAEPFVMIQGYRAPVVGRIAMDLMMVDVTNIPKRYIYEGAVVHLMNEHITLNTLAAWFRVSCYQVMLRFGPRVKKTYIFEEEKRTHYAHLENEQRNTKNT